VIEWQSDVSL